MLSYESIIKSLYALNRSYLATYFDISRDLETTFNFSSTLNIAEAGLRLDKVQFREGTKDKQEHSESANSAKAVAVSPSGEWAYIV